MLSVDNASTPEDLVQLAIQLSRSNPHYVRREDRHTFIVLTDKALHESIHVGNLDVTKDVVGELIACLDDAASLSAEQMIPKLGYFGGRLALLDTLVEFANQSNPVCAQLVPATLVEHLRDSLHHGLLPGETSHQIAQLETLIARHESSHSKWASDTTANYEHLELGRQEVYHEADVLEPHEKYTSGSGKVSLDLGCVPSPSIPTCYFPPTPFSMGDAAYADLELGAISYEFPMPQIPDSTTSATPRHNVHTWPR